jgi:pimeloyl-ACP methyl ester carboxylesterase
MKKITMTLLVIALPLALLPVSSAFVSAACQGRAQIIPDADHACNLDQPEKYDQAMREFAHSIGWA